MGDRIMERITQRFGGDEKAAQLLISLRFGKKKISDYCIKKGWGAGSAEAGIQICKLG